MARCTGIAPCRHLHGSFHHGLPAELHLFPRTRARLCPAKLRAYQPGSEAGDLWLAKRSSKLLAFSSVSSRFVAQLNTHEVADVASRSSTRCAYSSVSIGVASGIPCSRCSALDTNNAGRDTGGHCDASSPLIHIRSNSMPAASSVPRICTSPLPDSG